MKLAPTQKSRTIQTNCPVLMAHIWRRPSESELPRPTLSACASNCQACSGRPRADDAHTTNVGDAALSPWVPQAGADTYAALISCNCTVSAFNVMARSAPMASLERGSTTRSANNDRTWSSKGQGAPPFVGGGLRHGARRKRLAEPLGKRVRRQPTGGKRAEAQQPVSALQSCQKAEASASGAAR